MYARCGTVTCLHCGGVVKRDTVDEIVDTLLAHPAGTRTYALFPIVRAEIKLEALQAASDETSEPPKPIKKPTKAASKKKPVNIAAATLTDSLKERLLELRRRGFNRLFQAGNIVEFSTPESLLELDFSQPIFVLADRLSLSQETRKPNRRRHRNRLPRIRRDPLPALHTNPSKSCASPRPLSAPLATRAYREPEPRLFSFNKSVRRLPTLPGASGTPSTSTQGSSFPTVRSPSTTAPSTPGPQTKYRPHHGEMKRAAHAANIPTDIPWYDLTPAQQRFIEDGAGSYPGIRGFFAGARPEKNTSCMSASFFRSIAVTPPAQTAAATRLRAEARAVLLQGKNICEVSALTITEAVAFFDSLTPLALADGDRRQGP